ncbi:MAG: ATP-binding protein [Bullifex sp.]
MIFFFTSFVTTCSIMLFQTTLMKTLGYEFSQTEIEKSAVFTFANVIILTLFFSAVFEIRKYFTVTKPTKMIQACLTRLKDGDYGARIDRNRIRISSEFSEIAEDINSLAKELDGVEILRNDFISNVSHEIKTPLSIIQNYSILLSTPGLSEDKRMEYASVISHRCRKLALMVSDILKLNKLANQDIYPDVNEFDLSEEICSSLLSFEEKWTQKEIILSADIEEGIMFTSDSSLLDILWNNLFSNAFKFTPRGGTVSVKAKLYGDKAMVMVKDSGCGMNEDQLNHIWDKFYQCDPSSPEGGNGLGLPMVRRVTEIIHGEISVKSEPGKGSTFTVTLPGCRKG